MNKLLGTLAALVFSATLAHAAQFQVPVTTAVPVQTLNQSDQDCALATLGVGTANGPCAYVGQLAAMSRYQYVVPVTAFTITANNQSSLLFLNPAGTLATGTVTTMSNPSDGASWCIYDVQAQTALTLTAATGQTIVSSAFAGALTAKTQYCWRWMAPTATWYEYQ